MFSDVAELQACMPGHPPVPPARNYTARGQRLFKAWNDIHSDFDGLRAVYHKDAWISASFGEENPVAGSIEVVQCASVSAYLLQAPHGVGLPREHIQSARLQKR